MATDHEIAVGASCGATAGVVGVLLDGEYWAELSPWEEEIAGHCYSWIIHDVNRER